jgi:hypothetical protein
VPDTNSEQCQYKQCSATLDLECLYVDVDALADTEDDTQLVDVGVPVERSWQ